MYMYVYRFIIIDLQTIPFNLLILWSNSFPSVSWILRIVGWPSILLQTILFILLRYDFTYTLTCRQFCLFYLHIVSLITINFIQSWKYRYHNTCITNLQTILLFYAVSLLPLYFTDSLCYSFTIIVIRSFSIFFKVCSQVKQKEINWISCSNLTS